MLLRPAALLLLLLLLEHAAASAGPAAVMPNLLLPPWPPTYNLTKSTMTQSCFGPARINKNTPALNATTGSFLRSWGIVTLDFESQENIWGHHSPKDSDAMMLDEAVKMKAIAPDTKIWVYRNLVQAMANVGQLREKLEDPAYSGWWLRFGPEATLPRCELNPRLNKTLCSDLFHAQSGWTENGHDCGDVIPCGDYVFNHRNQSLRTWLVEEHMLGKMGMAHPAVDGYLIDDWYAKYDDPASGATLYGPSEIAGFIGKNSGIAANSTVMKELYGNWSLTTQQALQGVLAAGGFTWSGFNCMLDTDNGYGCPPSDLAGCGLHKTEGVPRANNVATAPLWHGRGRAWTNASACAAWTRTACSPESVFSRIPTELAFGSDIYADVAQFLLSRGPYGYMGWGWHGCVNAPPPSAQFDYDYGEPLGLCNESAPGVFTREWTKAMVTMDCNTMQPNITLAGHAEPIRPKPPPPPPPLITATFAPVQS
jgi:hypothetical protein